MAHRAQRPSIRHRAQRDFRRRCCCHVGNSVDESRPEGTRDAHMVGFALSHKARRGSSVELGSETKGFVISQHHEGRFSCWLDGKRKRMTCTYSRQDSVGE
ncbi:hypothetical protein H257_04923 [Aphanomyces astaci]|uniref:Uncharacterized protein n=1 Tax=Aphanomyces astaci TaxID=112090 RepID=W4GSA5_APHAT|nr:hypothetical protein H257_04923 [Aphanomyces astaci]ETV82216.1 hypothetical protein H257_04923 [Aphanomyces astaci]|eukprot:XP_009827885.1 hypothetical protein H257_04923 [Aphanomyces astaci]